MDFIIFFNEVIAKLPVNSDSIKSQSQRSNLPLTGWYLKLKDCFVDRKPSSKPKFGLLAMTNCFPLVIAKLPVNSDSGNTFGQRSNLPLTGWDLKLKDCFVDRKPNSKPKFGLLAMTSLIMMILSPSLLAQNGGFAGAGNR